MLKKLSVVTLIACTALSSVSAMNKPNSNTNSNNNNYTGGGNSFSHHHQPHPVAHPPVSFNHGCHEEDESNNFECGQPSSSSSSSSEDKNPNKSSWSTGNKATVVLATAATCAAIYYLVKYLKNRKNAAKPGQALTGTEATDTALPNNATLEKTMKKLEAALASATADELKQLTELVLARQEHLKAQALEDRKKVLEAILATATVDQLKQIGKLLLAAQAGLNVQAA